MGEAQPEEVNNKPKRRLLDFDESDEESNEEDPMKAELKYVKMFFIVSFLSYRFKNEPPVDKDEDPLGLWKTKRLEYPTLTRSFSAFQQRARRQSGSSAGWAGC